MPRLPPPPPHSAGRPLWSGKSERAAHESVENWELDAWIVGLRETGPECQGELGRITHRIAADSQVQGKAKARASQGSPLLIASILSDRFFPPLGWGGSEEGARNGQQPPQLQEAISPIATGLRDPF